MKNKLYEGKAKVLYEGDEPNTIVLHFKDDATAGNGVKKGQFEDKGYLNNIISADLLTRVAKWVPNHFIKRLSDREQLVKKVDIVPIEVIFRNKATGSFLKRMPFTEGDDITADGYPLIEFCYKNDEYGDPIIGEGSILHFRWLSIKELIEVKQFTQDVNTLLTGLFAPSGIVVVDGKLEFGRDSDGNLILADEICPDTLRLWKFDEETGNHISLDKDLFRKGLGGETAAYTEIAKLLDVL